MHVGSHERLFSPNAPLAFGPLFIFVLSCESGEAANQTEASCGRTRAAVSFDALMFALMLEPRWSRRHVAACLQPC